MNTTNNESQECNPLGIYKPGEPPVSAALLWVALVHLYCLIIVGTLGNALALWCVVQCKLTRLPVKVLLFSVFVPALMVCLVTRPVIGEVRIALLTCDLHRVSMIVFRINTVVYLILAQTEVTSIAAVAVIRAISVWAPQRPGLGLRGAIVLVTAICLYSVLSCTLGLMLARTGKMVEAWEHSIISALFFLDATLPALITAAAYIFIVFVIQRNKGRLAISQCQAREVTVMDQATRAMLAVFISNLIFGIPHSIYHLLNRQPHYVSIIFHVLFSTHFMVDPLAFVWFNSGYRKSVVTKMKKLTKAISPPPTSAVFTGSASSNEHHQQTSRHKQEDFKI